MPAQPTPKQAWRAYAVATRDALSPRERAQASTAILHRLLELPQVVQAPTVFCYVAVGSEVATAALLESLLTMGKALAVPHIVTSNRMEARRIHSLAELVPGRWGIPQPPITAPVLLKPAVTIVPGLVFSERGERIGRGSGVYDTYLRDNPATVPIALAFDTQIFPRLPSEPHDIPMRLIVTPTRIIDCPL